MQPTPRVTRVTCVRDTRQNEIFVTYRKEGLNVGLAVTREK